MSELTIQALHELPIFNRRDEILKSVDNHQVTIITAETGAGKSTQVPQYLAEHGYEKIIVTQPRILAARNLSSRVRQEYSLRQSQDCSNLVGYRTANERDDDPGNIILYCTDGLQLVRELTGSGTRNMQVLVLDEIHEWNENMEVLVAWTKKRCQEDPGFKVVLMSATIEAADLAEYFGAPEPIAVEGRTYEVEKLHGKDIITEILKVISSKPSNMLVFLPGKSEIQHIAEELRGKTGKGVPIIPLHGQLDAEAQQIAFKSYPNGKIILTTNVAQTSITIDDIDVVIDSGLERRSEVRSGVEGLFIAEVSKADCLQRAGRAGRTKEGKYILAQLDSLPCSPIDERPAYGIPEILRKHIDRVVLRLANISIDIEDLDFYHSPSRKTIKLAKRTLVNLGALTPSGEVTDIGRRMEPFPVESSYGRMLVEASAYSEAVQAKLATIIAIQEVGGIVKGNPRYTGWRRLTRQTQSDLVAQYDVFLAMGNLSEPEFEDMGIITRNVLKAQEVNQRLHRDLGQVDVELSPIDKDELPQILKCIVAGQLHQLWSVEPNGAVIHIATKKKRELSNGTLVKKAKLIAGTPFDLEVPTPKGLEILHLVNNITAVDPKWLGELAPESFKVRPGKIHFDPSFGTLATSSAIKFNNRTLQSSSTPLVEHTQEHKRLFIRHYSRWLHELITKERKILEIMHSKRIPDVSLGEIEHRVEELANGAVSLEELGKSERIGLSKLGKVETYLGEAYRVSERTPHGATLGRLKKNRPSWKAPHLRKGRRK